MGVGVELLPLPLFPFEPPLPLPFPFGVAVAVGVGLGLALPGDGVAVAVGVGVGVGVGVERSTSSLTEATAMAGIFSSGKCCSSTVMSPEPETSTGMLLSISSLVTWKTQYLSILPRQSKVTFLGIVLKLTPDSSRNVFVTTVPSP